MATTRTIIDVTPNMLRELAESMGTTDVVAVTVTPEQERRWYAHSHRTTDRAEGVS